MPDYGCYSIWVSEAGGIFENINPQYLKISPQLQKKINDWENKYESTLDNINPVNSGFTNFHDKIKFEMEGVYIWKELVKELNETEIIYFSVIDSKLYTLEKYPTAG